LAGSSRLTLIEGRGETNMRDFSFSASAEWVVGVLLAVVIVAAFFV
jgi:hypothetical protein